MLHLLVMRHAKSRWDEPDVRDFDRGLNARGTRAAAAMGAHLASRGLVPAVVLCSTARRARDTLSLASAGWTPQPSVAHERAFYGAEPEDWLAAIRGLETDTSPLMTVGHNPTTQELALGLVAGGDEAAIQVMRRKFPTGAVARIALPITGWSAIEWGSGELLEFIQPRTLDGTGTSAREVTH